MISRVSIVAWCRYFFVFFFFQCESPAEQIYDEFEKIMKDDNIDEKEYSSLLKSIERNNPRGYDNLLSGGSPDPTRVERYIHQLGKAKGINTVSTNIWRAPLPLQRFNINIYLENSASMNGYVGINSSFKTNLFKLLTDLKNFDSTDSLNLHYINTKSISIKENASSTDIDDFYKRLNPTDFRRAGGSVASTDIEKILKALLHSVSSSSLNVFISDCVFSPGKTDATKYLDGQYAAIYSTFTFARQKQKDLAVIILQCSSRFEGTYFDYLDIPHPAINLDRPYYIWFIGTQANIKRLIDNKIFELLKNGYTNKLVIQSTASPDNPPYKILLRPKIGTFNLQGGATGGITDAEISQDEESKRKFGFNLVVDFSKSLQDPRYFLDTTNYRISKNYRMKVVPTDDSVADVKGFSHHLALETTSLQNQHLIIDVLGKVPAWVYHNTSRDDSGIEHQTEEASKTFGLKYLVEGVCDAFYPKSQDNVIATISISIKK